MMIKRILLILLQTVVILQLFAQNEEQGIQFIEGEEWDKILNLAQEQNKLIFMDCYTTWCGPCKKLASDVFPQPQVGEFFNANFINVKYDMEKGVGKELASRYKDNIVGYPTLLLIDQNGKVVHQMAGYQEPDALIASVKDGMEGKNLFAIRERYNGGDRDLQLIADYLVLLQKAFLENEKKMVLDDLLSRIELEDLKKQEVWNLVGSTIKDPYSKEFEFVVFNFDHFVYKLKVDGYKLERQIVWALEKEVNDLVNIERDTLIGKLVINDNQEKRDYLLKINNRANLKRAEEVRAKFAIQQLLIDDDLEKALDYIILCKQIRALGYSNSFLNGCIQYITENTKNKKLYKPALDFMIKIQEEENSNSMSANYYNTIASLYSKLGNKKQADENMKIYNEKQKEREESFKKFFEKVNQEE